MNKAPALSLRSSWYKENGGKQCGESVMEVSEGAMGVKKEAWFLNFGESFSSQGRLPRGGDTEAES